MVTTRLRSIFSSLASPLRRYPSIKRILKRLEAKAWRYEVNLKTRLWRDLPDANRFYWVNPERIKYAIDQSGYDKFADRGKVIGGTWELEPQLFSQFDVFQAFEQHFNDNVSWQQTKFYSRVFDEISSGKLKWGCRSQADLDRRMLDLDKLYLSIKKDGYKSQVALAENPTSPYSGEDEITVRIDRSGRLLFEDGRHRLAIAKLLNLDLVPVKITVRHIEWYRFTREIRDYAKNHGDRVYQPISHPDLADLPSLYGHHRTDLIADHLGVKTGDLLDIGAHWGYFCHQFERRGFDCCAVERDYQSFYILDKLRIAEELRFTTIHQSIFDYGEKSEFDIVLALNIFHHFLKQENLYNQLVAFLRRVKMGELFFQAHSPDSPQMAGAYRNYEPDQFVQFILDNSMLNQSAYIGETHDGRPLFKLTAS